MPSKNKRQPPEKIWVFAPYTQTGDENLDYYCDYTQSIAEYENLFFQLKKDWEWVKIRLDNVDREIEKIRTDSISTGVIPIILNLCDGDGVNGAPGISVIQKLEKSGITYTGADETFYAATTSKIPMKAAFDSAGVPTPKWEIVKEPDAHIFNRLGSPLILKPAVSGGSMGVGIRNVVYDFEELKMVIADIHAGYRGWNLMGDGIIAESFVQGREFTVFISGSSNNPGKAHVYTPVERVFHPSLPADQRFLSFDRLWETYDNESPMPDEGNFYEYRKAPESLQDALKGLSWAAYCSTNGMGYTRVDIRQDDATGELYVLEVNAQCGISEDENFTSIGAILRFSGIHFSQLVSEIIADGKSRKKKIFSVINVTRTRKARA